MKKTAFKSLLLLSFLPFGSSWAAELTGLVYPLHDIILSAGVSGIVLERNVVPGQAVAANQLLVSLDDRLQAIEVERRKAILDDASELNAEKEKLALASKNLEISQKVFDDSGSISIDELNRVKTDYFSSKGRYELLLAQKRREEIEYRATQKERDIRHIYAPVSGVVIKISLEPGEWAKQGDPLVHLVDASWCVIKFAIPVQDAGNVHVGSVLPVSFLDGKVVKKMDGKVSFVSPIADPASGLVEAKITFSNASLMIKPGVKASVSLK